MVVPKFFKDLFTERDGVSWCLGRVMAAAAFGEMSYKFLTGSNLDWQSFAIGVSALIASVAAKNYSEKKNESDSV